MHKVLLFGANGYTGTEIARELKRQNYNLTVAVRSKGKADKLFPITQHSKIVDFTNINAYKGLCNGFDVVVSALGKSVSINDKSKPSFNEVDLVINSRILDEAQKSVVKKFVYVSAMNAEKYLDLEYFRVHYEFSEKLIASGINYSIIKPPAIFSAFIDLIELAKKEKLLNLGKGDSKINPIYEGDLAKICVDSINTNNVIIEAGGKNNYTRRQLNEIIQAAISPHKPLRKMPLIFLKVSLPILRFTDRNLYDKFASFLEVIQTDTNAPPIGEMSFEEYVKMKLNAEY